jgi:hypothetical protein
MRPLLLAAGLQQQGGVHRSVSTAINVSYMEGARLSRRHSPTEKAVCNAQGFFTFGNVKARGWYVMTSVSAVCQRLVSRWNSPRICTARTRGEADIVLSH